MTASITTIILNYVCPSIGCIMSSIMFAAPVYDLRKALQKGRMGALNPIPWGVMTGNCLGWLAYGYYTKDPFILASNLPGLVLSIWLNSGAAKLQYYERYNELKREDALVEESEEIVTLPQERLLIRVLSVWSLVLVYAGWIQRSLPPAHIVGFTVNINLIFFYGAPLEAILRVVRSKSSDAIHTPTMILTFINTSFWMLYGLARMDPVIYVPNGTGLLLGVAQGVLICYYPKRRTAAADQEEDESNMGLVDEDTAEEQDLVV